MYTPSMAAEEDPPDVTQAVLALPRPRPRPVPLPLLCHVDGDASMGSSKCNWVIPIEFGVIEAAGLVDCVGTESKPKGLGLSSPGGSGTGGLNSYIPVTGLSVAMFLGSIAGFVACTSTSKGSGISMIGEFASESEDHSSS